MELMKIENNLRLYLSFHDELNLVKVLAGTNDWDRRIVIMGVVKGEEKLADLLNEARIDHYTMGGDSFGVPPSLPVACEITPQKVVHTLAERFRTENEIPLRILRGEKLTKEELSLGRLTSLRVFSSSTTVNEGLQRVQKWFKNQAQQN